MATTFKPMMASNKESEFTKLLLAGYGIKKDNGGHDDCDDKLYDYLCRIPIPHAVDMIAEKWGLDYEFV